MICSCEVPEKEYSETTCTCCWTCKKCGQYGGCDNLIGRLPPNAQVFEIDRKNIEEKDYAASFDCDRKYIIDEKRWDIMERGLYRCLDSLYIAGQLTVKPKDVIIEECFIDEDGKERFQLSIYLEEK